MKKVLSLVLVLAMVLSVSTFAFATGEYVLPADDLQNEEVLNSAPIVGYEDETVLVWPQTAQVDLSRPIVNPDAKGTVVYTLTGNTTILQESSMREIVYLLSFFISPYESLCRLVYPIAYAPDSFSIIIIMFSSLYHARPFFNKFQIFGKLQYFFIICRRFFCYYLD